MNSHRQQSAIFFIKVVIIHLFGLLFIIGYQTLIILAFGETITMKGGLNFLLQVATFYIYAFFVAPSAFSSKTLNSFIDRTFWIVIVHIMLRGWIIHGVSLGKGYFSFILSNDQLIFANGQLIFIAGLGLFLSVHQVSQRRKKDYIMIQNIMAQMQLNAHMLFNALQYIVAKTEDKAPQAAEAARRLASIQKHSLIDIGEIHKVPLYSELQQVAQYLEFSRQLNEAELYIDYRESFTSNISGIYLPPFLLITVLENIIKYGVINDPDYPAVFSISEKHKVLAIYTFNYNRTNTVAGLGIGLNRIKTILEYFYPKRHTISISNMEERFSLNIRIML